MPSSACSGDHLDLHSFPTRRSSDLTRIGSLPGRGRIGARTPVALTTRESLLRARQSRFLPRPKTARERADILITHLLQALRDESRSRSEEHTSELQSRQYLVCRLLLAPATT